MDDNDSHEPDEKGHLDLKYRGLTELEDLTAFAYRIQSLGAFLFADIHYEYHFTMNFHLLISHDLTHTA